MKIQQYVKVDGDTLLAQYESRPYNECPHCGQFDFRVVFLLEGRVGLLDYLRDPLGATVDYTEVRREAVCDECGYEGDVSPEIEEPSVLQ